MTLPRTFCIFFALMISGRSYASAIASAQITFSELQITPLTGLVEWAGPWRTQAFAEARNSLGELDTAFDSNGTASASAVVAYADGSGSTAGNALSGGASANSNIPSGMANSASTGRWALINVFMLRGGTGSAEVNFSAAVSGSVDLSTDGTGVLAQGEMVFSVLLDGTPVLFSSLNRTIGPDSAANDVLTGPGMRTITLDFDVPYALRVDLDAETRVENIPEPASAWMTSSGILLLAAMAVRKRTQVKRRALRLGAVAICFGAAAMASYRGAEPPGREPAPCVTACDVECAECLSSSGGTGLSATEGNLREQVSLSSVKNATGPTLSLQLTYSSYNADGSRTAIDTVMGYGWTHSYNIFLFSQRGDMFRFNEYGRITRYAAGPGGTFRPAPGYFETLVRNPDESLTLTTKGRIRYRFAIVPGTPFLVDGPVYRLMSITDANGNITEFTYTNGNLTRVTDPWGRSLIFTYTDQNKLATVTDPAGRQSSLAYDATGRQLRQVTDAARKQLQYTYNNLYQLVRKTDRDGRVFEYLYLASRPYLVRDGAGSTIARMSNSANWATDPDALAAQLTRVYIPATTTRTDGAGRQWKYEYDQLGYITRAIAPTGAVTSHTWDPSSLRLATVTDPNGNTTRFEYDSRGNRVRQIDGAGNETTFTWETVFDRMTSRTDANGRVIRWDYDTTGNVIRETDPVGNMRQWTYDTHGNVLTEVDKRGAVTTHEYDAAGNLIRTKDALGGLTTFTYDSVGNRLTETDQNGHTTSFAYDALNRRTARTDALKNTRRYSYDGEGHVTGEIDENGNPTTYMYDHRGRLVTITDAAGATESRTYDAADNLIATKDKNGNVTQYTYDLQNRLIRTNDAAGNIQRQAYDPNGNRISQTDANGRTTTWTFDALNRAVKETNAAGAVRSFSYSRGELSECPECTGPAAGSTLRTRFTDPLGKVTYFKYDGLDRLRLQIRKEGDVADSIDSSDAVTRYRYDANGNVTALTEPNGNTTTFRYDLLNRQTRKTNAAGDTTLTSYDPAGNVLTITSPGGNVTTHSYDAANRLVAVADLAGPVAAYTWDPAGNRITEADGLGNTTRYTYDVLNRIVAKRDPLGRSSLLAWDAVGNLIHETDREGRVTSFQYDSIHRQIRRTDPLGHTTQFAYDRAGNLTRVTDAKGNATTYVYDAINRKIREVFADAAPNTIEYTYDAGDRKISRRDQKSQVTQYAYNDLHFLTKRTYPVGPADNFSYDLSGRLLFAERGGWVTAMTYDGADRLLTSTQNGKTVAYSYDVPARSRTLTYPGGMIVREKRDVRERLVEVNEGSGAPLAVYSYDLANRPVSRSYRNGTIANWAYNAASWITSLRHVRGSGTVVGFAYVYDKEGNRLLEQKQHAASLSEAYTYDAANRLTRQKTGTPVAGDVPVPSREVQYDYDPAGNWNSRAIDSIAELRTHNAVNEITTRNGAPLLSDANGNLTEDASVALTYDEANRLTKIVRKADNVTLATYRYDALGRRVESSAIGAPAVRMYYDGWRMLEEQSTTGGTFATYVFGGLALDDSVAMKRSGQYYYYHHNALGSIHGITDGSGVRREGYVYDAYGDHTVFGPGANNAVDFGGDDTRSSGASPLGNRFMFTGQVFDPESGLMYFRNRYYSSALGRFLTRDPFRLPSVVEVNLYEFTESNPVNLTDPLGLYACEDQKSVTYSYLSTQQEIDYGGLTRADRLVAAEAAVLREKMREQHRKKVCQDQDCGTSLVRDPYDGSGRIINNWCVPAMVQCGAAMRGTEQSADEWFQGATYTFAVACTFKCVCVCPKLKFQEDPNFTVIRPFITGPLIPFIRSGEIIRNAPPVWLKPFIK